MKLSGLNTVLSQMNGNYREYISKLCNVKYDGDVCYIIKGNDYYDVSQAINIPEFMELYGNDVLEFATLDEDKYICISNSKVL